MYKPFYFMIHVVKERMIGTKNIAKITKSMKMVSAAKLRGDQNRLSAAAPFAVCNRRIIMCTLIDNDYNFIGMDQCYHW